MPLSSESTETPKNTSPNAPKLPSWAHCGHSTCQYHTLNMPVSHTQHASITVGPEGRNVVIWVQTWVSLTALSPKLPTTVPIMGAVGGNFDFYGMVVEDPYLGRTPGPGVRVLPLAAVLREHRNTEKHLSQCPQITILGPLWTLNMPVSHTQHASITHSTCQYHSGPRRPKCGNLGPDMGFTHRTITQIAHNSPHNGGSWG